MYKSINNAVYRKTMRNYRKRIDVRLVNNKKDYLKCTLNPSYMSHKIFDNNLVAVWKSKPAVKLNNPCIGICILELGKVLRYENHYDYIKNKYNNKSKLLFTDTDSLMYESITEDVYEGFHSDKEMFDFSNYWTKWKYYDDSNKLIIGKMKDETGGAAIEEFVGLKAKMYSLFGRRQ